MSTWLYFDALSMHFIVYAVIQGLDKKVRYRLRFFFVPTFILCSTYHCQAIKQQNTSKKNHHITTKAYPFLPINIWNIRYETFLISHLIHTCTFAYRYRMLYKKYVEKCRIFRCYVFMNLFQPINHSTNVFKVLQLKLL